jgi:hypothetical protein
MVRCIRDLAMDESSHVNFVDVEIFEFLENILIISHWFNLIFKKCNCHLAINQFLNLFLLIFKCCEYHVLTVNIRIRVIWIFHKHLFKTKHIGSILFIVLYFVDKDTGTIKFTNLNIVWTTITFLLFYHRFLLSKHDRLPKIWKIHTLITTFLWVSLSFSQMW